MTNGQVVNSGIKMEVPGHVAMGTELSGAADTSGCCCRFSEWLNLFTCSRCTDEISMKKKSYQHSNE